MSSSIRASLIGVVGLTTLLHGALAGAQGTGNLGRDPRIHWFVADVQGSLAPFGQNAALAEARGLDPTVDPGLGVGLSAGVHVYLLRLGFVTVGVGASIHGSSGDRSPGEEAADPDGPSLRKRFVALAPQLSFNFGGRDGWSYVSAGPGTSRLSLFARDEDPPASRPAATFNYGGGARWFTNDHVAFSLDLRFYNARPLPATNEEPGSPRMTLMVLNIGASFK